MSATVETGCLGQEGHSGEGSRKMGPRGRDELQTAEADTSFGAGSGFGLGLGFGFGFVSGAHRSTWGSGSLSISQSRQASRPLHPHEETLPATPTMARTMCATVPLTSLLTSLSEGRHLKSQLPSSFSPPSTPAAHHSSPLLSTPLHSIRRKEPLTPSGKTQHLDRSINWALN